MAAVFAIGELSAPGTFFLLPFAIGAVAAAVLAFAGVDVAVELVVFIVVSLVALAGFRKLAHRLDRNEPTEGIGSKRLIGQPARVIEAIDGTHDLGTVRVDREEWRAESGDGAAIAVGSQVKIVEVRGTRVVVFPVDPLPPTGGSGAGTGASTADPAPAGAPNGAEPTATEPDLADHQHAADPAGAVDADPDPESPDPHPPAAPGGPS